MCTHKLCRFVSYIFDRFNLLCVSCPFGIKVVKDGIGNSVAAFGVLEIAHHFQSPSHLSEAALDDVGGADHSANLLGELKDRYQLVKVFLQAVDSFGGLALPLFFPGS